MYKSHYKLIKQSGGRVGGYHPGMLVMQFVKMKVDLTDSEQVGANLEKAMDLAEEEFLACHFLRQMNWEKHWAIIMHLENQFMLGVDSYPKKLTRAYNLDIKWKATPRQAEEIQKDLESITLATDVDMVKEKKDLSTIKCFNCNKFGHYQNKCPDLPKKPPRVGSYYDNSASIRFICSHRSDQRKG